MRFASAVDSDPSSQCSLSVLGRRLLAVNGMWHAACSPVNSHKLTCQSIPELTFAYDRLLAGVAHTA